MTVYFLVYGIMALSYVSLKWTNHQNDKADIYLCIISFLLLTIMFGLRHPSMGVDLGASISSGYIGTFEFISNMTWTDVLSLTPVLNYEAGYVIYNKIISTIFNEPQFFLFVTSLICVAPIIITIYYRSTNVILSVFIYMGLPSFLITFSGLRQAIALGICFFSILFVQKREFWKFVLLIALAWTFHSSAAIFLIAYPLYNIKLNKSNRYITILAIPIIYLLRYPLFNVFSKLFQEKAVATETGAIMLLVFFCLIYIFCMIFMDHDDAEQNGYMNLFLVACACQVFGSVHMLAIRVGYYFMIVLVLLLPLLVRKMKIRNNVRITNVVMSVFFVVYGLHSIYSATWARSYPYHWFWESIL